jgi:hypothetical protein
MTTNFFSPLSFVAAFESGIRDRHPGSATLLLPIDTGGKFVAVVVDTGGKFATGINDTSGIVGKFAAGVVDTGGKFATGVVELPGYPPRSEKKRTLRR